MRILVDGLSATSLSGQHVLFGHLLQLARSASERHEFFVLVHPSQQSLPSLALRNIHMVVAPPGLSNWKRRVLWQLVSFAKVIRETRAEIVFTPAGMKLPACRLPQVCLAQNPWCLTPVLHRSVSDRIKASLQRRAYRHAFETAALMAYNSHFMRTAYRQNAPRRTECDNLIVYQGLDDETHEAAAEMRNRTGKRSHQILAVSVMAAWKNIETLLDAVQLLRQQGVPANLNLVGPWADAQYEWKIRNQVDRRGLGAHVRITGGVSRPELYRQYAEATVFCLLSRCESFGIPALEAQLFGTPAVVSNGCAMPEICGPGAVSVSSDDAPQAAQALAKVLEDPLHRQCLADAAIENASKYRWSECSRPLCEMIDQLSLSGRSMYARRN